MILESKKGDDAMRKNAARSAAKRLCRGASPNPRCSYSKLSVAISVALSGTLTVHVAPLLAADASSSGALEEIIVTARKRTENLQDVPLSIDVYTSKDLQNLAISQFEDYVTMTPSLNFVSAGPGAQTIVMRGVSDGSNPNYAAAATSLFLIDDMSMNYYGVIPDIHWYDLERIEVLNGPQGTTFGAGAMAGAVRFITKKPDPTAFSAGVDLDGGKIDAGGHNGTVEAFVNMPLIADWTALRLSVYEDYHGGFINNLNDTRTWVNGVVSNNSQWAGKDYNTEKVTGARLALGQVIAEGWKASLTSSYQRQLTHGAWDEDPSIGGAVNLAGQLVNGPVRPLGPNNVVRFGPESKRYYTKTLDFHLDGDVGIGDLVFASTYWAQDDSWVNEYSEYMQYVQTSSIQAGYQQSFTCQNGPNDWGVAAYPGGRYSGCKSPNLWYTYDNNTQRWSNELRLSSKPGGAFHWLIGGYWEKTKNLYSDYYAMPGLQSSGQAWQAATNYYYNAGAKPPKPDDWYSYVARGDYTQVTEFLNVVYDITPKLHLEAGTVHFESWFSNWSYGGYWYAPQSDTFDSGGSVHWNSKGGLSYNVTNNILLYADAAQGFRDGGVNGGLPSGCYKGGAPLEYVPDSLTNYELGWKTTMQDSHLVWDGALYYMPWHHYQTLLFDPDVCASASFTANIGNARIYGAESNVKYQATSFLTMELSGSYNDSEITKDTFVNPSFVVPAGTRVPYVPYFNWSANARYERPIQDNLKGYVQYDVAHKGDMWNSLSEATNGLPRVLQPGYSTMNLRFGLNQTETHWSSELYITNLTNKNAVIYTNEGNFDLRYTRNEPRVFGVRLSYRFGKQTPAAED
jgi:iron complex outermembrane receptor protein